METESTRWNDLVTWRWICAITFCFIAIFDLVVIPSWFGIMRVPLEVFVVEIQSLPEGVQQKLVELRYGQHEPMTMKAAGTFYMAFGAILTGAAFKGIK